jgi:hypothetical protein
LLYLGGTKPFRFQVFYLIDDHNHPPWPPTSIRECSRLWGDIMEAG